MKYFSENEVVKVGETIAIIETNNDDNETNEKESTQPLENQSDLNNSIKKIEKEFNSSKEIINNNLTSNKSDNFFSPLVKNIARKENISNDELERIQGSGKNNRVTKNDILSYIKTKDSLVNEEKENQPILNTQVEKNSNLISPDTFENNEVIEMSRMRKMIADHMIMSKSVSAHVTSFNEVDMTKIVAWRNNIKEKFKEREKQNITFTPIIIEAIIKAILDFPMINISVKGTNIIKHKNINIGMATALADGNLIVPVIKNGNEKNLLGLTKSVNDLAKRAREGRLNPDDTSGGTFTFTNVGSFGSVMGTPIINQPQVAILAAGVIQKNPQSLKLNMVILLEFDIKSSYHFPMITE